MSPTSWWSELQARLILGCTLVLGACSAGADPRATAKGEIAADPPAFADEALTAAPAPSPAAAVATDPNLKIAFVGDTADGSRWGSVANLIKNEGAHAVMVAGDMTYDADPPGWWSRTEGAFGTTFPVFLARGNHDDSSWSGFLGKAQNHLGGATRTTGRHNALYKTVFKGLTIVNIKKGDTASDVNNTFGSDTATWKVCGWHQNQNKMQVGGKGDEMGWAVYEACRQQGAIIITGHEHTYHRTKTMTNTQTQAIDSFVIFAD
jgi:hypothetical protein